MSIRNQIVSRCVNLCGATAFVLLTGVLLAVFVSSAHARPEMAGQQATEERYAKMDADNNGKVTSEEFFATYSQMKEGAFKSIDADGDGSITLDEWKAFSVGHKPADPHAGMGAMGGAGGAGDAPANGTKNEAMPSLIMPPGVSN
jgi:hypothetical protein